MDHWEIELSLVYIGSSRLTGTTGRLPSQTDRTIDTEEATWALLRTVCFLCISSAGILRQTKKTALNLTKPSETPRMSLACHVMSHLTKSSGTPRTSPACHAMRHTHSCAVTTFPSAPHTLLPSLHNSHSEILPILPQENLSPLKLKCHVYQCLCAF